MYLKATPLGLLFAQINHLFWNFPPYLQPISYSIGDLYAKDGRALIYALEEEISRFLDGIVHQIVQKANIPSLVERMPWNKVYLYLYKALAEEVYGPILLMHLASSFNQSGQVGRFCILAEDPWIAGLLEKGGLGAGIWVNAKLPRFLDSVLQVGTRLKRVASGALFVVANVFRSIVPGHLHACDEASGRVLVEYNGGITPGAIDDLFWLPASGIDPQTVLVYFSGGTCVPTESDIAEMERQRLSWVSLPPFSISRILRGAVVNRALPIFIWRSMVSLFKRLATVIAMFAETDPGRCWSGLQSIILDESVEWWEAFFRRYRAIVHIHTQDTGRRMLVQSIASDLSGAISVGYHWSFLTRIDATQAQDQTVYFSWGPYFEPLLMRHPSQISRLFYCGHLSCRSESPSIERPSQVRRELESQGVSYVIALFDSSFDITGRFGQHSRLTCLRLYEAVVGLVERDPSLGLVIKPKCEDNLTLLPEVRSSIEALVKAGRCRLLDWRIMPGEAALASDILVGLSMNSAVIAGVLLTGKPGLHFDLSWKQDERLFQWGLGRVVFTDVEDLLQAIEARRYGHCFEIGDHTPILGEIDPFQDELGAERLGKYLSWYVGRCADGWPREEALAYATSRYEACWGNSNVVCLADRERFDGESKGLHC